MGERWIVTDEPASFCRPTVGTDLAILEQTADSRAKRVARIARATLFVCAGYYAGGIVACTLTFQPGGISGIWLPHGILLAALLLSPVRSWWWYAAALLPTHLHLVRTFQGPVPLLVMLIQFGGNLAQAALSAAVLRRFIGEPPRLNALSRMSALVLVGAFLGPCLISALVVGLFVATDWVADFWTAWQRRTFTVMSAAVIVTPPIVELATGGLSAIQRAPRRRVAEFLLLTGGIVATLLLSSMGDRGVTGHRWLLFTPVPFLLWSAVRFGAAGLGLHQLAVMLVLLLEAKSGRVPLPGSPAEGVLLLAGYTLAVSVPLMLLAALLQQYEQSQQQYRSVVEDQTELICRFSKDGTLTFVNGAYCRYFGRSREELIGQTFWQFIPPEQHPGARAHLASITPDHPVRSIEHPVTKPGGEIGWQYWVDRGFFDEAGHIIEFQSVGHDTTERKRAEEEHEQLVAQTRVSEALQEVDRRKNVFLATLAHELRNPLAPIGMAVELLRDCLPADRTTADVSLEEACDIIARQTAQLVRLVDDLVDVSRITQDKIRLNLSRVDLTSLVRQAAETARPLFVARRHELSIDVPDHPLPVRGDGVRLIQVISNLLNNAARYTDDGGRIALGVKQVGAELVLTVTDNGIGLPPDMLERVFEMFTQVDARADQPREGLGIGLALVKRLVEMHDGVVEAKSDGPGRGSEFIVTLPVLADRRDESPISEGTSDALRANRKRILVVDDNVDAARMLFVLLRLQRHEVEVAHDGVAALTIARKMNPDIVFLDLHLPKLDGIEVARRLREATDGTRPVLVALTGFGQEEDRRRTAAAGFDHHLTKPVDLEVVRSVISVSS